MISRGIKSIHTPLTDADVENLHYGDRVEITGVLYTARDATHRRIIEVLARGDSIPVDLKGQILFYTGPAPPKPGLVMGSIGPTTSHRMDAYLEAILSLGVKGTIGKGHRSDEAITLLKKYKAVYFIATGGAGALLSEKVVSAKVVAYEDLGTEAIHRLEVKGFPAVVANDSYGNDIFREAWKTWTKA